LGARGLIFITYTSADAPAETQNGQFFMVM
jgi:hypothetical protein